MQGNDARKFHTEPELLVGLFDIFYDEPAAVHVEPVAQAAADTTHVRESVAEQRVATGRGRKRKHAAPSVVGPGGHTSSAVDISAYRARRVAVEAAAASVEATAAARKARAAELAKLKVPELKDLLTDGGMVTTGKKAALVERLLDHEFPAAVEGEGEGEEGEEGEGEDGEGEGEGEGEQGEGATSAPPRRSPRLESDEPEADDDDDEHEGAEVYDLEEDALVGGVETAIDIWVASIAYQEAAHAPVGTEAVGDFDLEARRAYASKGQAAGKAWAEAVQRHAKNRASWQYVHRAYAHFYEDAMENGQRDTTDDSAHERGNRTSKMYKNSVMQGGTNDRTKTVQQTHHVKTADGGWTSKKSKARALPLAPATQVHIKRHAGAALAMDRPPKCDQTVKRKRGVEFKAEERATKRTDMKNRQEEFKQQLANARADGP